MDNDPDENEREGMRILRPDDLPDDVLDDDLLGDDPGLPHWTEPGTGSVRPLRGDEIDEDLAAWSSLTNSGPRWADDPEAGLDADPVSIGADDPGPIVDLGSRGRPSRARAAEAEPSVEDDFFAYDTGDQRPKRRDPDPRRAAQPARAAAPAVPPKQELAQRVGTAVVLAGVAVLCMLLGKAVTLVLIAGILGLGASELFVTLRRVGYQPATLLGLTATVSMPLAVYWRGEAGFGVVLFLTMVFGALWYLTGVSTERPVPNLGVTLLGVVYVGVLGGFGALLLDSPDGIGLLLSAIVLAVAYDVGGYFVGRSVGRSPLSDASPNKTVEGLLGGMAATVVVSFVVVGLVGIGPFDGTPFGNLDAILVGIAVAIIAPIGDLAESLMKRDLGVKDLGTVLPGHGGVLDRFDALLFVLPTVYYTVRLLA